ncbi:MAG: ATP/GTP-binding protein [Lepagella sp.]
MIRSFWVENYFSISDRQSLYFEVNPKDADWMQAEVAPGVYLSKLGIIYGANASGKSNMLKAMINVFSLLFKAQTDRNAFVEAGEPFALSADAPTRMSISFYANGIRYDYGIECDRRFVIHELLEYYPKKSKSLFYERNFVGKDAQADIKFGSSVGIKAKTLATIKENTLNNHSVLSTYGKVSLTEDATPLANLYNWIKSYCHGILECDNSDILQGLRLADSDRRKKSFYIKMLKKADFNISDFHILSNGKRETISFVNTTSGQSFELTGDTQSAGTMRFILNLRYLYDAICDNHIYLLDELGETMHYDLLLYYINVFLHNSDASQLIFTSQERALLAEDMINSHRHSIWFAEKSHDTAASEYTRADDYGLHKNLSLYNAYCIGRLGAKPELGSPFINLDYE